MKRPSFLILGVCTHLMLFVLEVVGAEPLRKIELGEGNAVEFNLVKPGSFSMGSPDSEPGRGTDEGVRTISLTQPYYLGRTEVTVRQFEAFTRETKYRTEAEDGRSGGYGWDGTKLVQSAIYHWRNPGYVQSPEHPVTLVTWADANRFCQWLSIKAKQPVRLPTEAQWEYACRAGETGPWSGGATDEVGWTVSQSESHAHPVGMKKPNAWGFYDMHGNVWEWCEDWYGPYASGVTADPVQGLSNLSDKPRRVLRGGSWLKEAKSSRSAARYRNDPRSRNPDNGFRVLMEVVSPAAGISIPGPVPKVETASPAASPPAPLEKVVGQSGNAVPPPAPAPPMETAPVRHSFQEPAHQDQSWIGWIVFGVIFVVMAIVAKAIGSAVMGSSGVSRGVSSMGAAAAGMQGQMFQIRPVKDGFWVKAQVPEGTRLEWACLIKGQQSRGELEYLGGPQGQFVFTAVEPAQISVRTLSSGRPMGGMDSTRAGEWGRAAGMWDELSGRSFGALRTQTRSTPPQRPSAY